MRRGAARRGKAVAGWVGFVALLLAACSDGKRRPQSSLPGYDEVECTPGESCSCGQGYEYPGSATCDAQGNRDCECESCPALDVKAAPTVQTCSGYPFGSWQLIHAELSGSRQELSIRRPDGSVEARGSCPMVTEFVGEPSDRYILTLHENGLAESATEPLRVTLSWSESCVIGKTPALSCRSGAWEYSNCKLDCDICSCDSIIGAETSGTRLWDWTEEALFLNLSGEATAEFAYCMTGNKLELSAPDLYLVYSRINKLAWPTACSLRTAETCLIGAPDTCRRGGCVGEVACTYADTEAACLAAPGCSWDANGCSGNAPSKCDLADYGVVPGCGFTTRCQGEPVACESRIAAGCKDGCTLAACKGGALQCEDFSVSACPPPCAVGPDGSCVGPAFDCSTLTQYACLSTAIPRNHSGQACVWDSTACRGVPVPCDSVPLEMCDVAPGCSLVTTP